MRKTIWLRIFKPIFGFLIMFACVQVSSGQTMKNQSAPIPENIDKIFKALCHGCHTNDGNIKARTKLNFSIWTEYDSLTVASKASEICSELLDEAMPPKPAREKFPELIPKKEQVDLVCGWADTFKLKPADK